MKKLLVLICTALMVFTLCVLPIVAYAEPPEAIVEDAGPAIVAENPEPTVALPDKFTWEYLATTGGTAILVYFIVQYAKAPLDKVWKIPTRLLVYGLCLIALIVSNTLLKHGLTGELAASCIVNAFISAFSAYGMYEVWYSRKAKA